jgi:tRNA1Val (adenine37-N6)-methyltransferase
MSNSFFRFKQFMVRQEGAAMKVGTDGVLLGAWVNIENAQSILDVGSGTGLIALMLAQRTNATVDAVEIDESSHLQAFDNVKKSPWSNRINLINKPFQAFASECETKYDLIVSNPPYFVNSLKSPEASRSFARHAEHLPHLDLLDGIVKIMKPSGRFCGIFPYVEGNVFVASTAIKGLFCVRKLNVTSKPKGVVKRILVEFSFSRQPVDETTLSIYTNDGGYTDEYKELTKDFYLAF